MARVLIPTRNRPTSLAAVVEYLDRFHPGTRIIVADGSADAPAEANARAMAAPGRRTEIDYRRYPYDMPFFDRLLDVLRGESDPFFIMGSDDDYPMMDVMGKAEKALAGDPTAATAMGALVHLFLRSPEQLQARLGVARPVMADEPARRARSYAAWSFSTTYAVTRRELLIERYERAREMFLVGFYDFGVGLHDCMWGRIRALPDIGFIATRNFNHSYLRPESQLTFLRRSGDLLRMVEQVAADLARVGGLDDAEAAATAEDLIRRRIAESVGAPAHRLRGFENSSHFLNGVVQRQLKLFNELFEDEAEGRRRYIDRIGHIAAAMRAASVSQDNAGESHQVETLDGQMGAAGKLDAAPAPVAASAAKVPLVRPAREPDDLLRFVRNVDPDRLLWSSARRFGRLHILGLGQSNLANHGAPRAASAFGAALVDGARAPMADPIPGGSGEGGSVWPRLADRLAAAGMAEDLLVSLRAVGGSSVADWAEGGPHHAALAEALQTLAAHPAPPTHVVWHQGERDTLLETSAEDYMARFRTLHALVARHLPDARWIVCRASYRMGRRSAAVVAAQDALVVEIPGCIVGPDTDALGRDFRYDDTHFNAEGLASFSAGLVEALLERLPARSKAA